MNKDVLEWLWRILSAAVMGIVVPLGIWVWNINVQVQLLENDLENAEGEITKLEAKIEQVNINSTTIVGIGKDLEHMSKTLDRIARKVDP